MPLVLRFSTDNAAFTEDPEGEAARILRDCAFKVGAGHSWFSIMDTNGNKVGTCNFSHDGEADDDNDD